MKPFILSLLFCLPLFLNAQPGERLEERIQARRVAFITEKLQLSPEEAQLFWPIYNQQQLQLKAIRKEKKADKPVEGMTEVEAEAAIAEFFDAEERELALRKLTAAQLKKAISARKIAMLQKVEREFKMQLLQEVKERRNNK